MDSAISIEGHVEVSAKLYFIDDTKCEGDVFKNIPVGSRARITVRVWRDYHAETNAARMSASRLRLGVPV